MDDDITPLLNEHRCAREQQRQIENSRLKAHRRIGRAMRVDKQKADALIADARSEVDRWARESLCSQDYIDRWSHWLALPLDEFVPEPQLPADRPAWPAPLSR